MTAQPIGPGSILVCIGTQRNDERIPHLRLTMDALYRVAFIGQWLDGQCDICGTCQDAVVLVGRTDGFRHWSGAMVQAGYCPTMFRPLNDGDTSRVTEEETYDDIIGAGLQTYRVLEPTS